MPLAAYGLELVRDGLALQTGKARHQVATLSCPDVVAPADVVARIFPRAAGKLTFRADSAAICGWHKQAPFPVPDTRSLFAALGLKLDAFDVTAARGYETIADLNDPLPRAYHHRYDLVFDCISNQCFNVAQVLATAAQLPRVGGVVAHVVPAKLTNQGFWDVCPTAFAEFYAANGYAILRHQLVVGVYRREAVLPAQGRGRVRGVPDDAMNVVLARRERRLPRVVWPTMAKFRANPKCLIPPKGA